MLNTFASSENCPNKYISREKLSNPKLYTKIQNSEEFYKELGIGDEFIFATYKSVTVVNIITISEFVCRPIPQTPKGTLAFVDFLLSNTFKIQDAEQAKFFSLGIFAYMSAIEEKEQWNR